MNPVIQNFADLLRARWPHLIAVLALLLGLSPSALPSTLTTSLRAVKTAMASQRWDAALDNLDLVLTFEPAVASLHYQSASLALANNDPLRANAYLDSALEVFPGGQGDHCLRANISLLQQKAADAEAHWRRAAQSCPNQVHFLRKLAELYWDLGDLDAALPIYQTISDIRPEDPDLQLKLGILYAIRASGESLSHLRAAQLYSSGPNPLASALIPVLEETASEENPAFTLARIGQILAQQGAWIPAEIAFRQSLTHDSEYTQARAYLGLTLEQLGKDGYPELRAAISESPALAIPRIFMAYHWQKLDRPEKARRELEIAARLDPTNPAISVELGTAYAALGDIEAAKQAYRLAAELAPQDPLFWTLLAEFSISHEIEILELGLPAARNAVILSPGDAAALDMLGYAHLLLGNLELAERLFYQAVAEQPALARLQFHLGLLRQLQGDPTRARAAWRMAIQLDPQGPIAALASRALQYPQLLP